MDTWWLGDPFLRGYYAIHDVANQRIGLSGDGNSSRSRELYLADDEDYLSDAINFDDDYKKLEKYKLFQVFDYEAIDSDRSHMSLLIIISIAVCVMIACYIGNYIYYQY